jgi:DNA-binding Xre family transcriptional regulator
MHDRHISVRSLAESIRIQRATLENYCAGRVIPADTLAEIARKLETSVAYLSGISTDPRPAEPMPRMV